MSKQVKGVRVRTPEMIEKTTSIMSVLRESAKVRGAVERDYSVLEHKRSLLKKYGDDEKLIYELAYQGGQDLALRYDLTTQHMLYAPQGRGKSFQMGKVYRRENPSLVTGRYREFYQFDYDIKMYPEKFALLECLQALWDFLQAIKVPVKEIVINQRNDEFFFGDLEISPNQYNTIYSSVDKLDKYGSWEPILGELKRKGIENPERIQEAFTIENYILEHTGFLDSLGIPCRASPTLVRGLSYYTGFVFEVIGPNGNSIAGGGQYGDSIGFSIGIDRVLELSGLKQNPPLRLFIICFGDMEVYALKAASRVRKNGYSVTVYPIGSHKRLRNTIAKLNKPENNGWFTVMGPTDKTMLEGQYPQLECKPLGTFTGSLMINL